METKLAAGPAVGDRVFVRAVTHYYTGRIEAMDDQWIRLGDAAWIADTGRFSTALVSGALSEVEPYPGVCFVARGAIVDLSPWAHALPREQK